MNRWLNRREFFRGSARWGLLGVLTASAAVLVGRGQTCSRTGGCAGCGQLAQCGLPTARQFRQTPKGGAK